MDSNNFFNNENMEKRTITPELESAGMARASRTCGIIALISIITFLIYPAIALGSVAIILALLSRGSENTLSDRARRGLTNGIIALTVNVCLLIGTLCIIFSDGPYKQQLNTACEQMYGQTFDNMINDAMDGTFDLEYHNLPGALKGGL